MQPLNTPPDVMVSQAEANLARDLPLFLEREHHTAGICIVGGAPSLTDTLPRLQVLKKRAVVVALNNTHDWLIDRGIVPGLHVMLDAREKNAEFVRKPHRGVTYLIAAQCHPAVFDALKGHDVIVWVADVPGMRDLVDRIEKPITCIGGGSTVGLKAMMLAYLWGFRSMHLFGMDSCYREDRHHAYPQPLNDGERRIATIVHGKPFTCAPWMLAQADDFQADSKNLAEHGVSIRAYGEGLLQTLLKEREYA